MATKSNSVYRFKTVMVDDFDRKQFTSLRDRIAEKVGARVTDKDLFGVIFENRQSIDTLAEILGAAIKIRKDNAELAKLEKAQAKLAAKLAALNPEVEAEAEVEEVPAAEEAAA